MRVLVVDDEAPARTRLKSMLADEGGYEVVGEAANGEECLRLAARLRPDVVLLDIRMPGMEGIEAARHLATLANPPAVIFVTAYDAFAIEAFDAQAVGYLLKPVRRERLAEALRRAATPTRPQLAALTGERHLRRRRIAARLGDALRLIPVDTIRYFQAEQKYVTVHHEAGADLIDESLRELEQEFPEEFVRIHRNALVALKNIVALERDGEGRLHARVEGVPATLPVSRRHAPELRRRIQEE
jgi:two-component system, LytTR family, response regulator AlgR